MAKVLEKLQAIINEAINDGAFPGAVYGIVLKNKVYTNCLGMASLYPNVEVNKINTIYDMASLSKVVSTTTCLLKLMEEGRLRLGTSVSKYLPKFPHQDITIYDLMIHTSGLPADVIGSHEIPTEDALWEQINQVELIYPKNTKLVYSDIGYILLGKVVEVITGEPLDVYSKKVIFDPLEMFDTGYNPSDKARCAPTENRQDRIHQGILKGEVHDEKAYIMHGVAGHAGLFSTINDVTHFIKMILNNGVYNNLPFLSPSVIDLLYTPQIDDKIGILLHGEVRGLGWILGSHFASCGDLTSNETLSHTGFTGTNIWIDRKNEIGFAMLTNRVHPTRDNPKHIEVRAKVGNFIMSHLKEIKEELNA